MQTELFSALIAFLVVVILMIPAIPLLRRRGIIDKPGQLKSHQNTVPTMAGIILCLAFFIAVFLDYTTGDLAQHVPGFTLLHYFVGITLIVIVGIIDDIWSITAQQKLLPHTIIALYLSLNSARFDVLNIPFLGITNLPEIISIIVTTVWIVVILNAINIIDGIDGLLSSFSTIYFLTYFAIGTIFNQPVTSEISSVMVAISLGYGVFNFPPAKVFMGNAGSHFIGLMVAIVPLIDNYKANTMVSMIPIFIILSYPLLDLGLSLLRRLRMKISPFSKDLRHLHHMLYYFQNNEKILLVYFTVIFAINSFVSILASLCDYDTRYTILFIYSAVCAVMVFTLIFTFNRSNNKRKNLSHIEQKTST